jgi:hypothetical protein
VIAIDSHRFMLEEKEKTGERKKEREENQNGILGCRIVIRRSKGPVQVGLDSASIESRISHTLGNPQIIPDKLFLILEYIVQSSRRYAISQIWTANLNAMKSFHT